MFVISTVQLSLINGLIVNFMNVSIAEANLTSYRTTIEKFPVKKMFKSCPPAMCSVSEAFAILANG